MSRFSIFGASGFIGTHLVAHLKRHGHEVTAFGRDDRPASGAALGHAIYCVGLTANFRSNLTGTARAHVGLLADTLDAYRFESFLYLSSTRVYAANTSTGEDAPLLVQPNSADQVYNISKLAGEALCLARAESCRVVRLSNVVGPGDAPVNFLPSLLDEARSSGKLLVRTSPQSSKDYVDIDDVCRMIERIALNGKRRLYNVASGVNTSNQQIAELVERHLGCSVVFAPGAPDVVFPPIDISRIREEFAFSPVAFESSFEAIAGRRSQGKA
jgi:nucleoside-diphosphate-sugar epimerase